MPTSPSLSSLISVKLPANSSSVFSRSFSSTFNSSLVSALVNKGFVLLELERRLFVGDLISFFFTPDVVEALAFLEASGDESHSVVILSSAGSSLTFTESSNGLSFLILGSNLPFFVLASVLTMAVRSMCSLRGTLTGAPAPQ